MVSKIAYLTIDDAPSQDFVDKVTYLYSKNVPAVFFCSGKALDEFYDLAVSARQYGFVIANHGYDHVHFSEMTVEACKEQIGQTDKLIAAIYRDCGETWEQKYFRFPYGDKGGLNGDEVFSPYSDEGAARKKEIQNYLRELGYSQPVFEGVTYRYYRAAGLLDDIDWHWTYDVREWGVAFGDPEFGVDTLAAIYARMDDDEPEGCRGLNYPRSDEIVLMHDHTETSHIFEPIIERLLNKGLVFRLPR
jgi:peptidoglycan-N-acetylglucosamine deacetylase